MKWLNKFRQAKTGGMLSSLVNARDRWGVRPSCVIDVGAAQGRWSLACAGVWPDADYLLVEPLAENLEALARLAAERQGWKHVAAAAGETAGEVAFSVSPDLDGSAVYDDSRGLPQRMVPVVTLDSLRPAAGEILLKLDTHGYELPILAGAVELLHQCSLLVIEAYGQRITSASPLMHELCAHLADKGFRVADVVDVLRRPSDGSFWQADVFFLKESHPVFSDAFYH
jgi:FkbM family methyltransferase